MYRGIAFRERDLNKLAIGVKLKKIQKIKRSFASHSFNHKDCHSLALSLVLTHTSVRSRNSWEKSLSLCNKNFFLKHLLTLYHAHEPVVISMNSPSHTCVCVLTERALSLSLACSKQKWSIRFFIMYTFFLLFSSTSCLPVYIWFLKNFFLFLLQF